MSSDETQQETVLKATEYLNANEDDIDSLNNNYLLKSESTDSLTDILNNLDSEVISNDGDFNFDVPKHTKCDDKKDNTELDNKLIREDNPNNKCTVISDGNTKSESKRVDELILKNFVTGCFDEDVINKFLYLSNENVRFLNCTSI